MLTWLIDKTRFAMLRVRSVTRLVSPLARSRDIGSTAIFSSRIKLAWKFTTHPSGTQECLQEESQPERDQVVVLFIREKSNLLLGEIARRTGPSRPVHAFLRRRR